MQVERILILEIRNSHNQINICKALVGVKLIQSNNISTRIARMWLNWQHSIKDWQKQRQSLVNIMNSRKFIYFFVGIALLSTNLLQTLIV